MKLRGALLTAAVAAAVTLIPVAASGQAAPTLTVTPLRADRGDPITIVVDDCTPATPDYSVFLSTRFDDVAGGADLTEASPGRWTATVPAPGDDLTILASCEGVELQAKVDVDNPRWFPTPISTPMLSQPDPPEGFFGSDCPDGTTARVLFQAEGRPAPVVVSAPINGFGDWNVDLPAFPDGTEVQVSASCGSVVYSPARSYVAGGSDATTTSTTTLETIVTTPPGSAAAAAPAAPVAGTPAFTG